MVPQIRLSQDLFRNVKKVAEGAWLILIITFSFRRVMGFVVCALRLPARTQREDYVCSRASRCSGPVLLFDYGNF